MISPIILLPWVDHKVEMDPKEQFRYKEKNWVNSYSWGYAWHVYKVLHWDSEKLSWSQAVPCNWDIYMSSQSIRIWCIHLICPPVKGIWGVTKRMKVIF